MKKQIIFAGIFSIIIGFGALHTAFAVQDELVAEVNYGAGKQEEAITVSDLEVEKPGILPTSNFYFLKQWGRNMDRLFTFSAVAKAELELKITNQIAAEALEVEKTKPNDVVALKKALENYTKAQERLNVRIGKLPSSSNPNVEKLLKEADEKTAKHSELLEQLSRKSVDGLKHEDMKIVMDKAKSNMEKTFVASIEKDENIKQKAEDQIKRAGVAIEEASNALRAVSTTQGVWQSSVGGEVDSSVTVPKQTQSATFGEKIKADGSIGDPDFDLLKAKLDEDRLDIFNRQGNLIAHAKSNFENAKTAYAEGNYGQAYGLARSAEVMARNSLRFNLKEGSAIKPIKKAEPTQSSTDTSEQLYKKKLEDNRMCGPRPGAPGNWNCKDGKWRLFDGEIKSNGRACTQEAKLCPDGSSVGRTGPNCEFAVCSTQTKPTDGKICTQQYDPVCGIDGKTYGNACMAKASGAGVKYRGECGASVKLESSVNLNASTNEAKESSSAGVSAGAGAY